jgi:hypothetical protein
MTRRGWVVLALLVLLPGAAGADTFFTANVDGAQEVPPTGSPAVGFGRVMLNESETQIVASVYYSGLGSGVVLGHIHGPSGPGGNAPVLFDLAPQTGVTEGSVVGATFAITPSQVQQLKSGQLYFNIHTTNFPGGEIRGQLRVDPALTTSLSGAQEVPGVATPGSGRAFISLNASRTQALVTVRWNALSANASMAHLHAARSGVEGGIICDLAPDAVTNGTVVDRLCALTPTQAEALRTGQIYVNVHTATNPDGEVRGQVKRSWNPCDFDGDGKSDKVIVRNTGSALQWWVLRSSNASVEIFNWGLTEDFSNGNFSCTDVDGDGRADATVWREGSQSVFWTRLSSGGVSVLPWGTIGDDPRMIGDYDGDGRDDYTVFRVSQGQYWTALSTGALELTKWGMNGDFAVSLPDYDSDGRTDHGIQRAGLFWMRYSADASTHVVPFGLSSDFQQAADFDGDGRSDIAVTRIAGSSRQWWIQSSLNSTPTTQATLPGYGTGFFWGSVTAPSAIRSTADFDGDGTTEIAIWRPNTAGGAGLYWVFNTKTGVVSIQQWGIDGDRPVHSVYWR